MRKIAAITGTRAEYGVMKDLFQKLNNDPDIDFKIIITGQHLLSEFGNTFKEVQKDFPNNYKVKSHSEEDSRTSMAVALGKCITGIVGCFKKIDPEFVLVTGDRGEALAAAIAASHMNIPVAHLTGGDITSGGTIDNSIRIAITSFSHIHFPPTKKSRENLIKIGESPSRIFHFGNPGLNKNSNTEEEIRKKFGLEKNERVIIVIQHPLTTEADKSEYQMRETIEAIKEINKKTIILYPNSDYGNSSITKVIKEFQGFPLIGIEKNLSREYFFSLLSISSVMVGNSSAALVESPIFGITVVDIGIRQKNREKSFNVINVPHDRNEIKKAIERCLFDKKFKEKCKKARSPYQGIDVEDKIIKVLKRIRLDRTTINKTEEIKDVMI